MKLQRLDLFSFSQGQQYGVLMAFTEGLQQALHRIGIQSAIFACQHSVDDNVILEIAHNAPDCSAGFNVTVEKNATFALLGIPHLAMIVDSASYFPQLLQNPNAIVSFVDEDSCSFFKLLGAKHVLYLPHAIDRKLLDKTSSSTKRDLDVVMCGSLHDFEEVASSWRKHLSSRACSQLIDMTEKVLASPTYSHLQAFVELVEERGSFEEEIQAKSINKYEMINSLDIYIRGIDRLRIVDAIERPIHIFGAKQYEELWKKSVKDTKKLIFHGEVPYADLGSVLARSKIVINSFPMFKRALHERILASLAYGASVLSNDNSEIQATFTKGRAVLTYLSPHYDQANVLIEQALNDEEGRLGDVLSTHDIIRDKHTWDSRAATLEKMLPPMIDEIRKSPSQGVTNFFYD